MEIKSIDSLSISECCKLLKINNSELPDVLSGLCGSTEMESSVILRLKFLLTEDKTAFEACSTLEDYKRYLAFHIDGLYREQATQQVNIMETDIAFENKKRKTMDDFNEYLEKNPNGKYAKEVARSLKIMKVLTPFLICYLLSLPIIIAILVYLI